MRLMHWLRIIKLRKACYEARLVYFGLDNLDAAIERVKVRVAMGRDAFDVQ